MNLVRAARATSTQNQQVCFTGTYEAGFRALALAYTYGLKVARLSRVWTIDKGEPRGPEWRMEFVHPDHGKHPIIDKNGLCYRFEWR